GFMMAISSFKLRCAILGFLIAVQPITADSPLKKEETILSRFTGGELFEATERENRDKFLKDCGLSLPQVVKAFGECKITLVNSRPGGKEAGFDDLSVKVEGKTAIVLKDARKKDV